MTRLVVVYDTGAADPGEIHAGLAPLGDVVFAVPPSPDARALMPLLREYADTVPIPDGVAEAANAVRRFSPAAVLTFSERRLRLTAGVAGRLGLRGHSRDTAVLLTDKYRQRQRLNAAGVGGVRSHLLTHAADWASAVRAVGLPAVLKPATGEGSRNTHQVDSTDDGAELTARLLGSAGDESAMVLEERLAGRDTAPLGDYVSVESVVVGSTIAHLAVTGKFPLLAPFRELGQYWPACLSTVDQQRVLDLAGAALTALGVHTGATHTEVKLTPEGPRIIEVNGRLGGHLNELAARAHDGLSLVRIAGRAALGHPIEVPTAPDRVYFQYFTPAPRFPCDFLSGQGAERVRTLPGVTRLRWLARRGTRISGDVGWHGLSMLSGDAPDHQSMLDLIDRAQAMLLFRFATAEGTVEATGRWLSS